ncbi:MAG: 5-formyltetrahydrofolate cyclo-ligase [archaeon]
MKSQLRKDYDQKRLAIDEKSVLQWSKTIIEKLSGLAEYQSANTVLYYVSKRGEVFTHDLIHKAFGKKRVVVPKGIEHPFGLGLNEISSFDQLAPGRFGILEPLGPCRVSPEEIDLVVVPGIAFDECLHRLGHGHGYYDRLLAQIRGKKIGLAFDFQVLERLPAEEHDVRLDMIITDKRILNFDGEIE